MEWLAIFTNWPVMWALIAGGMLAAIINEKGARK